MTDLFDQMKRNPAGDWAISDVVTVCEQHRVRCKPPSGGGTHYKVSHPNVSHIHTVPFKRPIKPVYIRRLIQFLEVVRRNT